MLTSVTVSVADWQNVHSDCTIPAWTASLVGQFVSKIIGMHD